MRVFIVVSGEQYEFSDIEEVFDSEDKAQEYMDKRERGEIHGRYYDYIECIEKEVI